jgi:hypothetical protein
MTVKGELKRMRKEFVLAIFKHAPGETEEKYEMFIKITHFWFKSLHFPIQNSMLYS